MDFFYQLFTFYSHSIIFQYTFCKRTFYKSIQKLHFI